MILIVVSAEEDVFEIICLWIDQKKDERMPKFNELFRHVRLIYISRDNLCKRVKKHSLVKNNEQCLSVTLAIEWLDRARKMDLVRLQPIRKSLEKHVIVIAKKKIVCYLPDNDTWYELPKPPSKPTRCDILASRGDKVDKFSPLFEVSVRYDPLLNRWTSLTKPKIPDATEMHLDSVTVTGEGTFAAFCWSDFSVIAVWKYDVETNSWRSITLPDPFHFPCVVFVNEFVYAIGGLIRPEYSVSTPQCARLDTVESNWEQIARLQTARYGAFGVAAHGKIYVVGGYWEPYKAVTSCEAYNLEANEWHYIASPPCPREKAHLLCHGTKLYLVGGYRVQNYVERVEVASLEYYDIERDEWSTRIPIPQAALFEPNCNTRISACSAAIPKRTIDSFRRL